MAGGMERITITLEEDLLKEIDALSEERGYQSRSEALRDMAREVLAREATESGEPLGNDQLCYGSLTYVYDHAIRDLPNRLTDNHHAHHALSIATTHVHINAQNCLEVSLLAGTAGDLRKFADSVSSQRGVRYGKLHIIPLIGRLSGPLTGALAAGGDASPHSGGSHDDHDH
ncbi:CopG family transcriptional regulator, nickel-responsive regulator [Afifella marina DSM 2698]|uniref:Putative nickel-responsive regulator n=2 Tax=Afifella marina TaxID=1080 RepID=A0A1G5M859_AFIMA|nr:CopG family transcriptional regulator, nickel-responsive regulator [Afifella marina DSM 2698]